MYMSQDVDGPLLCLHRIQVLGSFTKNLDSTTAHPNPKAAYICNIYPIYTRPQSYDMEDPSRPMYTHICVCIHIYIYIYEDLYLYMYVHIHISISICMYSRIYIYTCFLDVHYTATWGVWLAEDPEHDLGRPHRSLSPHQAPASFFWDFR